MRHVLLQVHLHPHHEDIERGLLILFLLMLVVMFGWVMWHLPTFQPSWNEVLKPDPLQFWTY